MKNVYTKLIGLFCWLIILSCNSVEYAFDDKDDLYASSKGKYVGVSYHEQKREIQYNSYYNYNGIDPFDESYLQNSFGNTYYIFQSPYQYNSFNNTSFFSPNYSTFNNSFWRLNTPYSSGIYFVTNPNSFFLANYYNPYNFNPAFSYNNWFCPSLYYNRNYYNPRYQRDNYYNNRNNSNIRHDSRPSSNGRVITNNPSPQRVNSSSNRTRTYTPSSPSNNRGSTPSRSRSTGGARSSGAAKRR